VDEDCVHVAAGENWIDAAGWTPQNHSPPFSLPPRPASLDVSRSSTKRRQRHLSAGVRPNARCPSSLFFDSKESTIQKSPPMKRLPKKPFAHSRRNVHRSPASRNRARFLRIEQLEDRRLLATQVFANVPEAANYTLAYELAIPNTGNFRDATPVPYAVNNSGSISNPIDRIAYYLELDTGSGLQWVYASMDAFTQNTQQVGLPHNLNNPVARQQVVSNLNVLASAGAGVTTGVGITTGSIEMWPSNYSQATTGYIASGSSSAYDWNDSGFSAASGYGSFQVHNYGAGQVLLAYNRWGTTGNSDLGIGNRGTTDVDWTFAQNAATYTVKNLAVLVRQVHQYATSTAPPAPGALVANAPELADYQLVHQKNLTNSAKYNAGGVGYNVDNTGAVPNGSFDRVAYYLPARWQLCRSLVQRQRLYKQRHQDRHTQYDLRRILSASRFELERHLERGGDRLADDGGIGNRLGDEFAGDNGQ
jgi:hypothetical protein